MSSDAEIAAARLEPKFGRGVTMSGALIMAAGMAALIGIVHHYGAGAVEHALWFQVGVFGLAFLLMLARPARRRHNPEAAIVTEYGRQTSSIRGESS